MMCEHTVYIPSEMEDHLFKLHKTRKMCPICGIRVSDVSYHKKTHLPDERQLKCKECDKVFHKVANLMSHMIRHTGSKPFACKICPMSFRMSKSLHHHIMKTHPFTSDE